MSEFIATPLGNLPSAWKVEQLVALTSRITDGAHFSPAPQEDGEIIANVKDMNSYGFNYDGCTRISKKDFDSLKNQHYQQHNHQNQSNRKND